MGGHSVGLLAEPVTVWMQVVVGVPLRPGAQGPLPRLPWMLMLVSDSSELGFFVQIWPKRLSLGEFDWQSSS